MATNKLSLNIPDIMTGCVIRVEDTSVYEVLMPYVCPTLQVTVPGYSDCVTFTNITTPAVAKGFVFNLTACNLETQFSECGVNFDSLPDGIYTFNYSMSPNDRLFVEYDHLRVTAINKKIKLQLCELQLSACQPSPTVTSKLNHLMTIMSYVEAAKAKVEFCDNTKEGMILYNYANKLIDEFNCKIF